ncbi:putative endoribonuclease L-PSP [Polystyrenella longa]|uniref:Putative endoribonuclease L-PSP n=1 Tax=Polystyrenella longa TaxID=2528007 RepID=A0A518CLW4_9PLAN|nr:RidA family protein [Polystyrenella longa]QDU80207.1 putative endoribonuclease L-PSP [Polystyrenella longa]
MGRIEDKMTELNIELPTPPPAVGYYVPALKTGNLVMTSGQLPFIGKELPFKGKLGNEIHDQEGQYAARLATLNALAQIKACIGDLDLIKQVVRVEGFIQSADKFNDQALVLNSASELLVKIFGDAGKHTRIAVGVSELPLDSPVEISVWVEV